MDFLMLFPHHVRIVIEIDGKHHYAENGRAAPSKYAAMVEADRDLRLAGYQVFRFGSAELPDKDTARTLVHDFFRRLFARFPPRSQ